MKPLSQSMLIAGLLFFIFNTVHAQPDFPDPGMLYGDQVIPRIDILIHPDSLALIYEYPESDHEYPATFVFDNGTVHDTLKTIGFRLRGNTSRVSKKKSFKVSFNTFNSGRKYYGVEKMNLNGEHNDPSIIRSKLCWDILRQADIPAPRSNHVTVFINGDYYGLYINVEHIDEEFVEKRFENNDGNLYKCLYPADLHFLGADPDLYKLESGGRRVYELKTNESADDYSDLAHFIDVLNNLPLQDLPCALEKLFNVYDYLKIMAVDVITANWDGYIFNKNNFYLYHNLSSGKFEYIPYDLDNTYGIDWFGIDWSTRNIYTWQNTQEYRPLFERILQVQRYKDIYSGYLKQIAENIMDPSAFFVTIEAIRDKVYPSVVDDPYYPQDYGYTPDDFLDSYTQPMGGHVPIGLEPYITQRLTSAMAQLVLNDYAPVMKYFNHTPAITNQEIWFSVYVEDDHPVQEVMVQLTPEGGLEQFIEMYDDGQHHDREAGDGFYGASAGLFPIPVNLAIEVKATDNTGQYTFVSCEPIPVAVVAPEIPMLFINEFMADNETTIADENGNFSDWVEVYNAGVSPVWLGNLYLTDNLTNPDKWQMPDHTLASGQFVLFWADEKPEQGPFHADFKLDKDGEEIGIFGSESMGFPLIDSVLFGVQSTDISYGRYPDGSDNWEFLIYPTPGFTNASGLWVEEQPAAPGLHFYPNPTTGPWVYLPEWLLIHICDLSGKPCISTGFTNKVDVSGLLPGMYIIKDDRGRAGKLIVTP